EPEPVENEFVADVKGAFIEAPPRIQEDPRAIRVIQYNMFDIKSVQEAQEAQRQINEMLNEAERLLRAGQAQQARNLVDQILERDPLSDRATELREMIEEQLNPPPAAAEGAAPAAN